MTSAAPRDTDALESALLRWDDAVLAAAIFAIDPMRCGGVVVKAQCGPVRDRWCALVKSLLPTVVPFRRIPLDVTERRLIGGMDLAATLAAGHAIAERGLLAEADGGVLAIPSAERANRSVLAALATALDDGVVRVERDGIAAINPAAVGVLAFDESRDDEAPIASLLTDRLAIQIDLDAIPMHVTETEDGLAHDVAAARDRLDQIAISGSDIDALCRLSLSLGIASIRAPLHAVRVAQASAALHKRDAVTPEDLEIALRLTLVPRATQVPAAPEEEQQSEAERPPQDPTADDAANSPSDSELEEMLLAAAKAALPPGILDKLKRAAALRKTKSQSGRAGAMKLSRNQRGRRAGSRRGDPRSGGTLDLLATVRAAAPWQIVRKRDRSQRAGSTEAPRLEVRRDDFRLRRFQHQSETATIFVVDASGSAALHRLAEAKGAVELLLADCYARRDHVALIAFRGKRAELLLPPTRSLVRAKRSLAGLPGGGGTPLATATDEALALARAVARKGQSPTLVFLTDGRANINRSGVAGRPAAESDAHAAARTLKAEGITAIVIDTSQHAGKDSAAFASAMGATYLPLPHADASALSTAIRHAAG